MENDPKTGPEKPPEISEEAALIEWLSEQITRATERARYSDFAAGYEAGLRDVLRAVRLDEYWPKAPRCPGCGWRRHHRDDCPDRGGK